MTDPIKATRIHIRALESVRIGALDWFERWVWVVMRLVTDDYGVLPDREVVLVAADPSLGVQDSRFPGSVRKAMDHIITSGLFLQFTHQDQSFLCDPNWQDFEAVPYAKQTYRPAPTQKVFRELSEKTRGLFKKYHPNFARRLVSAKSLGSSSSNNEREGSTEGTSGEERPWGSPRALVAFYNASKPGPWAEFRGELSPGRLKKFQAYLTQWPDENWWRQVIVEEPPQSKFLMGLVPPTRGRRKPFKGSLEWLCQRGSEDRVENCLKVYEGRYRDERIDAGAAGTNGNGRPHHPGPGDGRHQGEPSSRQNRWDPTR